MLICSKRAQAHHASLCHPSRPAGTVPDQAHRGQEFWQSEGTGGHRTLSAPHQAPCSLLSHSLGGAPEGGGCWGDDQRGGVSHPRPHSEQIATLGLELLSRVQPLTLGNGLCVRRGLRVHLLFPPLGLDLMPRCPSVSLLGPSACPPLWGDACCPLPVSSSLHRLPAAVCTRVWLPG